MERPIVIEDREELIYMLCEASELEHMIMTSRDWQRVTPVGQAGSQIPGIR